VVRRVASLLALMSIVFLQVHDFLPHHHHEQAKSEHRHEQINHLDQRHTAQAAESNHELGVVISEAEDHEVSGHPDKGSSIVTHSGNQALDLPMLLADHKLDIWACLRVFTFKRFEPIRLHPNTGPPGTRSSRAPPVPQLT
jgi:hypothetical protein